MWSSDAESCFAIGVCAQKLDVVHKSQRPHRTLSQHFAVVEIVVKLLGGMINFYAGKAIREAINHVITAQLAIGDDIDARQFLALDRSLYSDVVNFFPVDAA